MTPEQLQAIREWCEKATQAKWESYPEDFRDTWQVFTGDVEENQMVVIAEHLTEDDAYFIAHARTDIPALLDEIERLRGVLVVPKPDVSLDGNQWCALYGDNLQVGVAGFGDTVEDAYAEFVANWTRKALEGSQ